MSDVLDSLSPRKISKGRSEKRQKESQRQRAKSVASGRKKYLTSKTSFFAMSVMASCSRHS